VSSRSFVYCQFVRNCSLLKCFANHVHFRLIPIIKYTHRESKETAIAQNLATAGVRELNSIHRNDPGHSES